MKRQKGTIYELNFLCGQIVHILEQGIMCFLITSLRAILCVCMPPRPQHLERSPATNTQQIFVEFKDIWLLCPQINWNT